MTVKERRTKEDKYVAFVVMLSPALILFQQILIGWFKMGESSTTVRVLLTAFPLLLAAVICFRRYPKRFIVAYLLAMGVLVLHSLLFPENVMYLRYDALRFTLPVVLLSGLCASCVGDPRLFDKSLYVISWITFFLTLFYVIGLLTGIMRMASYEYSMSVSYALLLPMASLYDRHRWYSLLATIFLFIVALLVGSRGAVVIFAFYVVFVNLCYRKFTILVLLLAAIAFVVFLPDIMNLLDSLGITSRTLDHLVQGQITDDTGRSELHSAVLDRFKESPLIGIGMWGDRVVLSRMYCHNVLLEIFVDFGLLLGPVILVSLFSILGVTYYVIKPSERKALIRFFILMILPLMFSRSYLTDQLFGVYCGIVYILLRPHLIKPVTVPS